MKKHYIFPIILLLSILYKVLIQAGIRIEEPRILAGVLCILCIFTFYNFIIAFKNWLKYTEERDYMKKELKESKQLDNDSIGMDQMDSKDE